jgi:hypothetical protein
VVGREIREVDRQCVERAQRRFEGPIDGLVPGSGGSQHPVARRGAGGKRRLYDRLGYVDAGVEPVRVSGTIMLRGRPFEVDDTLVYLKKAL